MYTWCLGVNRLKIHAIKEGPLKSFTISPLYLRILMSIQREDPVDINQSSYFVTCSVSSICLKCMGYKCDRFNFYSALFLLNLCRLSLCVSSMQLRNIKPWYHLYVLSKEAKLIETESKVVATRAQGWEKWGDADQDRLPVIRWIISKDLTYSMVTVINNTILYTWKLLT